VQRGGKSLVHQLQRGEPMVRETARTLIVGADGFLGRNLVNHFEERGWPFHPIGRAAGDLTDWSTVAAAFRAASYCDRILHVVTRQRTGQAQYGMAGTLLAVNARIHLNVLEAWRQFQPQAKLVSTGSSCAYPERDRPIPESDFQSGPVHNSVRGYALAKQLLAVGAETFAAEFGLRHLHCILATLYGPCDHKEPDRSHFMGGMIERAVAEMRQGNREFTVWGHPDTVRDLLYVDDQIDAILTADRHFENTILNCTGNRPVRIGEAAEAVVTALCWDAKPTYPPDSFQGAAYKSIDSARFLEATGWRSRVALVDGIRRVLAADYGLEVPK
jgi:GDP-L-fucose synthase